MELFIGVLRDISRRKELEKEVIDASADEQRRIGQDIHDGVGQELTGLRYMSQTHAESLARQSSPDAKTAKRMTEWLSTVQQQLRSIVRRLVPVEVDQEGLAAALRGLAERTSGAQDLDCEFRCDQPITIPDPALATHLYRIAQEAVQNSERLRRPVVLPFT
ncbi:MAG: histidine kinase [Pirellulaceae bacterium]